MPWAENKRTTGHHGTVSPVSLDALSAGVRWSPLEALQLEVAQAQARAAHAEAKAEALRALRHFRPAGWMIWVHRKMRQTHLHLFRQVLSELQESFQRNVPEMVPPKNC